MPNWYKKFGQTGQVIRPAVLRHTGDIGDLYVHAKPGLGTQPIPQADTDKIVATIDQEPEKPLEQPNEKPSAAPKEKKSTKQNVPQLYTVRTKSGIKLSKHNDGFWRTPEGQILDDPALIDTLERMATAQRQTAQMAPGYQSMPASTKTQRRRRSR